MASATPIVLVLMLAVLVLLFDWLFEILDELEVMFFFANAAVANVIAAAVTVLI